MGRGSRRVMEDRLRLLAQARELEEQAQAEREAAEASRLAYIAKLEAEAKAKAVIEKIKAEEAAAEEAAAAEADESASEPKAIEPGDGGWKSKMNKSSIASWLVDNSDTDADSEELVSNNTKSALIEMAEAALAAPSH